MSSHGWTWTPLGEYGVLIGCPPGTEDEAGTLRHLASFLESQQLRGLFDCVPATRSLLVYFNPLITSLAALRATVESYAATATAPLPASMPVTIPVRYGGQWGPDLEAVAAATGLIPAEVIRLHTSQPMQVEMIGFMPGFPYIGGLPSPLHLPRRGVPRLAVAAGSVAIANGRTGIYPATAPGGWHLIGRAAITLFDPSRDPPVLLQAGTYVQFTVDPVGTAGL